MIRSKSGLRWAYIAGLLLVVGHSATGQTIDDLFRRFNATINAGNYREAERIAQQMLRTSTTDGWRAASLNSLGRALNGQHREAEAVPIFEQALRLPIARGNSNRGWIPSNLGRAYSKLGRHADARRVYEQALGEFRQLSGQESPEVATVLRNLGWLHHDMSEYEVALRYCVQALDMRQRVLSPTDSLLGDGENSVGHMHYHLKQLDEAERHLGRALALQEAAQGKDHPDVGAVLTNLALVARDRARFDLAEPYARRVVEIRRKANGPGSADVAEALELLAGDLKQLNNQAEADRLLAEAARIRDGAKGAKNDGTIQPGETVEALSDRLKLMDGPTTVAELSKGTRMVVRGVRPQWFEVVATVGGKEYAGFVKEDAVALVAGAPRPSLGGQFSLFSSPQGRFKVKMPGTPQRVRQVVSGVENIAFQLEADDGLTYVVSYFDLPASVSLSPRESAGHYARGRQGTIQSESQNRLSNRYEGHQAMIQLGDGRFSRLQLYVVGGRQYQIIVDGSKEKVTSSAANDFLNSFALLD